MSRLAAKLGLSPCVTVHVGSSVTRNWRHGADPSLPAMVPSADAGQWRRATLITVLCSVFRVNPQRICAFYGGECATAPSVRAYYSTPVAPAVEEKTPEELRALELREHKVRSAYSSPMDRRPQAPPTCGASTTPAWSAANAIVLIPCLGTNGAFTACACLYNLLLGPARAPCVETKTERRAGPQHETAKPHCRGVSA